MLRIAARDREEGGSEWRVSIWWVSSLRSMGPMLRLRWIGGVDWEVSTKISGWMTGVVEMGGV